jgi:integrase/recombinase XerD
MPLASRLLVELPSWVSHLAASRGLAAATIAVYVPRARRFLSSKYCSEVCSEHDFAKALDHHLRELMVCGRGAAARDGVVRACRSLFEWAATRGVLASNPLRHVRGPKRYRREVVPLTKGEIKRLLYGEPVPRTILEMRDLIALRVAYDAALRPGEVGRLALAGVQVEAAGQVTILLERAKSAVGDSRRPLSIDGSAAVRAWLELRPLLLNGRSSDFLFPSVRGLAMDRYWVNRALKERCHLVGIDPRGRRITGHILRHSSASHRRQAGWDLRELQELLRHRDIRSTQVYTEVSEARLAQLQRRRDPLRKPDATPSMVEAGLAFIHDLPRLAHKPGSE